MTPQSTPSQLATQNRVNGAPVHPAWCDLMRCDTSAGASDIHHCSAPITWTVPGDDVELSLVRYQYNKAPAGYLLMVCHTEFDEHAKVLLSDDDFAVLLSARDRLRKLTGAEDTYWDSSDNPAAGPVTE